MAPPLPEVRVGQVWADNDHRANGRQVTVLAIISEFVGEELVDFALVAQNKARQVRKPGEQNRPGRRTRIRLDRFRPSRKTGYTLVSDVED
jgi:hypothetical protein